MALLSKATLLALVAPLVSGGSTPRSTENLLYQWLTSQPATTPAGIFGQKLTSGTNYMNEGTAYTALVPDSSFPADYNPNHYIVEGDIRTQLLGNNKAMVVTIPMEGGAMRYFEMCQENQNVFETSFPSNAVPLFSCGAVRRLMTSDIGTSTACKVVFMLPAWSGRNALNPDCISGPQIAVDLASATPLATTVAKSAGSAYLLQNQRKAVHAPVSGPYDALFYNQMYNGAYPPLDKMEEAGRAGTGTPLVFFVPEWEDK